MSSWRCWLLLLLAGCCSGRTPQDEHNRLLRFLRPDSEQVTIDIPVIRSFGVILDDVLDRVRCVQQGLTNYECTECLSVRRMLKLSSSDESSSSTHIDDVTRLSVILVYHVSTLKSTCRKPETLSCGTYDGCREELFERFAVDDGQFSESLILESLEEILRNVKAVYDPLNRRKCFSAEDLLVEFNNTRFTSENESFENIMRLALGHILRGDCIDVGEAVTDFIEYLFSEYGDKCGKVITSEGIEKMLNDLRNPPSSNNHDDHIHSHGGHQNHNHRHHTHEHDHDHDHDHDHNNDHDDCHEDHNEESHSPVFPSERPHAIYHYPYEMSSYTDSMTTESFNKNTFTGISESGSNNKRRKKRFVAIKRSHAADHHEHKSLAEKCFDSDMLILRFGHLPYTNVTRNEFLQMCPALIQQIVSGVCNKNSTKIVSRPSMTELYGYSSLAVFVISLCALGGIFILPIMAKSVYHYIMMGFIGLSFGTMASDSLLHLIPQALGLHSHDTQTSEETDVGVSLENIPFYLWKQLGVLGAIYCLFVFETIMEIFSSKDDHEKSHNHGHSHVPDKIPEEIRLKSVSVKTESTTNLANAQAQNVSLSMDGLSSKDMTTQEPVFKSKALCCGLTSLALVVTLGDAVHNFGDGLAIGAAFSTGLQGGLSTSLAILCHELPHEFGDFVVLISTGLSFWKALLINFISALSCFVGLYIGIQLGENEVARNWILTATAGIFLYVALADMLPELKQSKHGSPVKMFIVKNVGVLVGIFLMLLIAIYEDHFHI
ncbi:zinc transporter ZIP14-like [Centruroides sculpturatus]|uniref:zinc transporter ZIP14-like n=1 Tax=Centruroides sculpturatus TaxID=218467 RepID=UPI000C6EA2CE|nr:zinc transporter ZIP14-like [Centruroides sculpturatus]